MLPDDKRLLIGARNALAGVALEATPGARAALDAVDSVLCELLLRSDRGFYRRYHAEGIALADEGIALAAQLGISDRLPPIPALANGDLPTDAMWERIDALLRALEKIVRALGQRKEARGLLGRIVDWENSYHSRHAALPKPDAPASALNFTRENLLGYLQQKFPQRSNLSVRDVRILPGGFSKKTVLLDVHDDQYGEQTLVLRVEQPPRFGFWDGDQVANEFGTLQLVFEAGLLLPEPLWLETDKSWVGQKFIISRRASGQNVGNSTGASSALSADLIRDTVGHLVRIHSAVIDRNDPRLLKSHLRAWAGYRTLRESTAAWVEHWMGCIRDMQVRP